MKLYISADIEGVTGIASWDETNKDKGNHYTQFQEQMTAEVNAACEVAVEMGYDEILIKDAHDTGRNLILEKLPECVRLIRGWAGHPLSMVQEIDKGFKAAMFIGYHSRAGTGSNPMAHTMSSMRLASVNLNGKDISEFYLHGLAASYYGVPVVMVTGDQGLCTEVQERNENIATVPVLEGVGNSTISIHPNKALKLIRETTRTALAGDLEKCLLPLDDHFEIRLTFKRHQDAYVASFYPGAELESDHVALFRADDYFEIMRFMLLAW